MGGNLIVIFEPHSVLNKINVLSNLRSYLERHFILEGFALYVLGHLCSFSSVSLFFHLILKSEGSLPHEKKSVCNHVHEEAKLSCLCNICSDSY